MTTLCFWTEWSVMVGIKQCNFITLSLTLTLAENYGLPKAVKLYDWWAKED